MKPATPPVTTATFTVRLTAAEAARDDGASDAEVLRAARRQARQVTDAISTVAYVESEEVGGSPRCAGGQPGGPE